MGLNENAGFLQARHLELHDFVSLSVTGNVEAAFDVYFESFRIPGGEERGLLEQCKSLGSVGDALI